MASTRQVRDWALGKGWDVPARGQVRREIVAAFNAAHPDDPAEFGKGKHPASFNHYRRWGGPDDTAEMRHERAVRAGNASHPRKSPDA